MTEYLFAYGLLKRKYSLNPKYRVPKMPIKWIGKSTISGDLYAVGHYPGAIAPSASMRRIHGDVFQINNIPFFFKKMDQFEMSKPLFTGINEYQRVKKSVLIKGKKINCWIYIYCVGIKNKPLIASGQF
jgi:gamma-glutamylcyclotransferase (GGCT)/AIG2-like uncharacterized protein YtfP